MMLKSFYFCAIVLSVLQINSCTSRSYELIEQFFNAKYVSVVYVFYCARKKKLDLFKGLVAHSTKRYSIYNMYENVLEYDAFYYARDCNNIGLVIDMDCSEAEDVLLRASDQHLFGSKQHWLMIGSGFSNGILKLLESLYLNINTDIKFAINQNNGTYKIYDVYNPASNNGGKLVIDSYGKYIESKLNVADTTLNFYWKRRNMSTVTFRILTVLPRPFDGQLNDYLLSDDHREINTFDRFTTRLLLNCRVMFNFRLNVTNATSWGYMVNDNVFDGMVGALQNRTIDFGGSSILIRKDRMRFIDYGPKTWTFRSAFLFRNPKHEASFSVFLRPLSESVWVATIIALAIIFVFLRLSLRAEKYLNGTVIENNWSYLMIVIVSCLCQQGSEHTPRMHSGRVITFTLCAFTVLIYQFYSASIVSSLLRQPPSFVNDLNDLLHSSLKAGCEDIVYNHDYFESTPDRIIKELYRAKIAVGRNRSAGNFLPIDEGLRLVRRGNYAFQTEFSTAFPIIEKSFENKEICELNNVVMIPQQGLYFTFQKGTQFRDVINFCIRALEERGVYRRLLMNWEPRKPVCFENAIIEADSIDMKEFYPAFVAYAIGISISLLLLTIEIYVDKYKRVN